MAAFCTFCDTCALMKFTVYSLLIVASVAVGVNAQCNVLLQWCNEHRAYQAKELACWKQAYDNIQTCVNTSTSSDPWPACYQAALPEKETCVKPPQTTTLTSTPTPTNQP
ncbi:hypothetical protein DFQ27_002949 [Actinomortierella ambigua]|uniref:Secreted protein n=1 Tax=Actinomortierella ambigua TaxID=1343610 RepID=A0A9P6Q9F4_9FUNG|nr:hypothetical protein DFQ27_002949 [Actinomortierella ambigua]